MQSRGCVTRLYYDHFLVALIDGNLVYRTMTLHVTAEKNFRVDKLRVYGRANTVAEVNGFKRRGERARGQGVPADTGGTIEP